MLEVENQEEDFLCILRPSAASVVQSEDLQNEQYTSRISTFDAISEEAEDKAITKEKDSVLEDHVSLCQVMWYFRGFGRAYAMSKII